MDWMGLKGLAGELGLAKDALHIYGAFLIQLAAALALKRSLSSWLPWLCVLAAELVNESLDMWLGEETVVQPWQIQGATHDLVNTMLLPTFLLILCRYVPNLFRPHDKPLPEDAFDSGQDAAEYPREEAGSP